MTTYYNTLAEARQHEGSWLVMEPDDFEMAFLGCSLDIVGASESSLRQLWLDCFNIDVLDGFDPSSLETEYSDKMCISYMNHHYPEEVRAQHRLHPFGLDRDLEDLMLRDQIEAILKGTQPRLELPARFPHDDPTSIQDIKNFPKGRVQFWSGPSAMRLIDAAVQIVNAPDEVLKQLMADIDARWRPNRLKRAEPEPLSFIAFRRNHRGSAFDHRKPVPDLVLHSNPVAGISESTIREVLSGTRPRL